LASERYKSLTEVLKGDIGQLNPETQKGMKADPKRKIKGGLSLLKASLIHELYINSTIAGRNVENGQTAESGKNLKNLWTFLILLKHNASIRNLGPNIDINEQKKMIHFIGTLKGKFKDKSEVIERIHKKLLFDLDNGYLTRKKRATATDKFKAITIICITKEIIDYNPNK